jgi:predicted transcriptional regulator of viral defense system
MYIDRLTLSHVEQTAYFLSLKQGRRIVDAEFISSRLNISKNYATDILYTLAKKGASVRIGKGLYLLVNPEVIYGRKTFAEDPLSIIDELMANTGRPDYYVAYASAAQVHGMSHQLPLSLVVAVAKRRKDINATGVKVHFVTVRKDRMIFGIEKRKHLLDREEEYRVSDLEKTILDCLERTELSGGVSDVARMIVDSKERIDWKKLVAYAYKFNNHALMQRLGYILDKLVEDNQITVEKGALEKLLESTDRKKFAYLLEPKAPDRKRSTAKLDKKWMIIENVNVMEWR